MNSPAEIIQELIVLKELASAADESPAGSWPIFVSFLPDDPDEAIATFDTVGRSDGRIMRTGERIEHPGVQIRVRGKDNQEAWAKADTIAKSLDRQGKIYVVHDTEEVYALTNISRSGPIIPLGIEEEGRRRYHFTINVMVTLSEVIPSFAALIAGDADDPNVAGILPEKTDRPALYYKDSDDIVFWRWSVVDQIWKSVIIT